MNVPEHSFQPVEARGGRGGVSWCFFLSPASFCLRDPQILPCAHLPSLLPPCPCPPPPQSQSSFLPLEKLEGLSSSPMPLPLTLQCGPERDVLLFSSSLLSVGLLTLGGPGSFKVSWQVVKVQMRSLGGFLFVCLFSKFRNGRHTCDGGIMVTEGIWTLRSDSQG